MIGFLARAPVDSDDGLWFPNCWAIHTLGMRAPLDVVFLDDANRVCRIAYGVPANQWLVSCPGARSVVELGSGAVNGRDILDGDVLTLEE